TGSSGSVGLGEAVIDVGAEGVQRDAALQVPLTTTHLGAAQTTLRVDADALGAELHRGLDRALEGTTVGDTTVELLADVLRHELSVDLGLADLLDVQEDLGLGHLLNLF